MQTIVKGEDSIVNIDIKIDGTKIDYNLANDIIVTFFRLKGSILVQYTLADGGVTIDTVNEIAVCNLLGSDTNNMTDGKLFMQVEVKFADSSFPNTTRSQLVTDYFIGLLISRA